MNLSNSIRRHLQAFALLLMSAAVLTPVLAQDSNHAAGDATAGAQAWSEVCSRCHNLRSPADFQDEEWEPIITHMRVRAGLTGQEARDILAFLQAANSPASPATRLQKTTAEDDSKLGGMEIYKQTCQACHGASGQGTIPGVPDFTAQGGVLSKSDAELLINIRDGFRSPGSSMAMPAKGGNPALTESDLQNVLNYIQNEFLSIGR